MNPLENAKGNELFWTKQQNLIYIDVIKSKHNIYVPMQWIDMNHLRKDRAYFGEALDLVEQFGIDDFIMFHMDFDPEIVAQFFASVHFHTDEERTMTWMTNGSGCLLSGRNSWRCCMFVMRGSMCPLVSALTATQSPPARTSFNRSLWRIS